MPYVPAHTEQEGNFLRYGQSVLTRRVPGVQATTNTSTTVLVNASAKSGTASGIYSTTFPGFRKPTSYIRNVMVFEDASRGYDFTVGGTGPYLLERISGTDSRHEDLLRSAFGPIGFDGGGVYVSPFTESQAVTEARLKLAETKVNVGVALGEAKSTINMIANRVRSFAQFARAMRRGNFRHAHWALFGRSVGVQTGKTASELWLEWRYGWSPLISDIVGGVELLQKGFKGKNLLFSVSRTVTNPISPNFHVTTVHTRVCKGEAWESCRVKLWGAITSDISKVNSLGLINPLSLAWELTTLSFVIDWLIPIGNWLESLTSTVGITFVGGCKTRRIWVDVTAQLTRYNGWIPKGKLPSVRFRGSGMQRIALNGWPWALPYVVSPLSSTNLTSAFALLRTRS